ncbi:MAG: hypothetical protein Fur006_44810 [Coleofasciculaceae cyanobacterium]
MEDEVSCIYSLKQGIEDGFLAPYRVYRITTRSDKEGWRPSAGQLDRYRRTLPDEVYQTPDFERRLVREARTKAIAPKLGETIFDRSQATQEIWYYEIPLPEGRKTYTKTKPIQDEEFTGRFTI